MKKYICANCGIQYEEASTYPQTCKICSDERQYIPASGQKWTTLEELIKQGHENLIREVEENLYSIKTVPQVGIGQNAYLIATEYGNILWDCITILDEKTKQRINNLGGLKGIVLSHPHYYSTIVEWAEFFDCPIYIHRSDKEWITRMSSMYIFWEGTEIILNPEIKVINLGGHFEGSSVLHWSKGAEGKGVLMVGDTLFIVPDQGWLSFFYSAPNRIPLPSFEVKKIMRIISNYEFNSIYGAFDHAIKKNGKESVIKSAERYIYHVDRKN